MNIRTINGITVYANPADGYHKTGKACSFEDKYACHTDARWYAETWDGFRTFCLKHSKRANNPGLRRKGLRFKLGEIENHLD